MKWVVRLYPKAWRERYGAELEALLDDSGHPWRAVPGILVEALRMQLHLANWKVITCVGLAGFLTALGVSFRIPEHFISTATVVLEPPPGGDLQAVLDEARMLSGGALSRTSLTMLIQDPELDLYKADRAHNPLEDVIENMKRDDIGIKADPRPDGKVVVSIHYRGENSKVAQATVQRLVSKFTSEHDQRQRNMLNLLRDGFDDNAYLRREALGAKLSILDAPSLSPDPVSPNRLTVAIIGLLVALGGLALLGVSRRFPRTALGFGAALLVGGLVLAQFEPLPLRCTSTAVLLFDSGESRHAAMAVAGPNIKLTPDNWPRRLTIAVRDTDPRRAQRTLQTVITRMIDENRYRRRALNPDGVTKLAGPWIEVLDPPSYPISNSYRVIDAATWVGIALILLAAAVLSVRRRTAAGAVPNPA